MGNNLTNQFGGTQKNEKILWQGNSVSKKKRSILHLVLLHISGGSIRNANAR